MIYKNARIGGVPRDFGVENGKFTFVDKTDNPGFDLQGREVIPGLIDIHTHGCDGRDTLDGHEAIEQMSRFQMRHGVTTFYPTTMAAGKEKLSRLTETLPATTGAAVPGFHLEGPFLSTEYKGGQPAEPILNARLEDFADYHHVGLMTVAPEFPGAVDAIKDFGIPICLGHTGCDYEAAMAAFAAGAVCVTHAFNAMAPLHHRSPGLMGAAMETKAYIQVISDGFHLHPAMVRMLYRTFGPERMILISDSIRATGLPDGDYETGGQTLYVREGKALLADGTICGSTATLLDCVKQAIAFGIPKEDAIAMASATPAAMMGLKKGQLEMGFDADFVVMDDNFDPVAVCVGGNYTAF